MHDVLRSPGQPLDASTRAFMEPRLGHDFSKVRVHNDAQAAKSALAVQAQAYTVGRHVVLGARLDSFTSAGRAVLAHELAHVVQQQNVPDGTMPSQVSHPSDSGESNAEQLSRAALAGHHQEKAVSESAPIVARQVLPRQVHCTAGSDGAPADPVAGLSTIVADAVQMASDVADLLRAAAELTKQGSEPVGTTVDQAFNDRFGEPVEVAGGFMNRITGTVRPTFDAALSEEMFLVARRLDMIANQLERGLPHFICLSDTRTWGGRTADCAFDAQTFPNFNGIFICPGFWQDPPATATLLIHETAHMIWERVFHGAVGSGGRFRHAECYATFVAQIFGGKAGTPPCPPI